MLPRTLTSNSTIHVFLGLNLLLDDGALVVIPGIAGTRTEDDVDVRVP